MGKGVGQVANLCRNARVPCIGFAGRIESRNTLNRFFTSTRALTDLTSLQQAKASPALWLERAAEQVSRQTAG
jgi:glycerate kinase